MNFDLWHTMLNDAVRWQHINEDMSMDIYRRTAVLWGENKSYWINGGGGNPVDLTKLFEQYKLLENLTSDYSYRDIPWGG